MEEGKLQVKNKSPDKKRKRSQNQSPAGEEKKKKKKKTVAVEPLYNLSDRGIIYGFVCPTAWSKQDFLTEFREAIEFQGWEKLLAKPLDVFEHLVEEFYSNLQSNETGNIGSIVQGIDIRLTKKKLSKILKVSKDGMGAYFKENWPVLEGVTPDQIQTRLFTGPPSDKQARTISELREPVIRLFHTIASKIVLPRGQGRIDVRMMDAVVIYCLLEKIKISLPSLILSHMIACLERSKHALPYGGWMTLIFQHFNVPLGGEFKKMSSMSNQMLGQKGMAFEDGELRMKDGYGPSRTTKAEAGETSSGMQGQAEFMKQIMDAIAALGSNMDTQFSKVHAKLEELEKKLPQTTRQPVVPSDDEEEESEEDDAD